MTTTGPAPLSADRFFEVVLPALARERARAFPALAQRACIVVDGKAWTLALHDDQAPVTVGGDPAAPFQLWLSADAFAALVDGRSDDPALSGSQVGYRGDLRVLEQLGRLLAGGGNAVDVRGGR